jgi:hypothetical protein
MVDCIFSICETYGWIIDYVLDLRYSVYLAIIKSSQRRNKEMQDDKSNSKIKKSSFDQQGWTQSFKMDDSANI